MTTEPHFIGDNWQAGNGDPFSSINPGTGKILWTGNSADESQVDMAVASARNAFSSWACTSFNNRERIIRTFGELLKQNKEALSISISLETGKPLWESKTEVDSMVAKIQISIESFHERTGTRETQTVTARSVTRHKPHGVIAVFGPYNFPGHLPNGHIVPALLSGNTVVFKPSRHTPMVAIHMIQLWQKAGIPKGVINLVQGKTGAYLSSHKGIDGLFFTGSSETGIMLHRQFAGHPEKILVLEMGGNNPLVIGEINDLPAAVYMTILSSYISAGQRCTCARRLFVPENTTGQAFINKLAAEISNIRVGLFDDEIEPFMGPVISTETADTLLEAQRDLLLMGGTSVIRMKKIRKAGALLSPGLIDVTKIKNLPDREYFGPFLQLIRYKNFDDALRLSNETRYGLSAGLLSGNPVQYERFKERIRAGALSWNRPLTGASSQAPFGGTGISGNHRAGAWYAADYCAYPVASLEAEHVVLPDTLLPGIKQ